MSCYPDNVIWPHGQAPTPPADPSNPTDDELLDQLRIEAALTYAWSTLVALTAGRLAPCPITVRPKHQSEYGGSYREAPVAGLGPFVPHLGEGLWTNQLATCNPRSDPREIELPGPVGGVVSVELDGELISPSAYRLDGQLLVRTDGGTWPRHNDFIAPGGWGVFEVTYHRGAVPGVDARAAVGILAAEYLKAASGDQYGCRLPSGTTSVVRQGISIEIENDADAIVGRIPEIAGIVRRFNPHHQKSQSRVFSPDRQLARPVGR